MRVMVTVEEIVQFFEKYQENTNSSQIMQEIQKYFLVGLCLERRKLNSRNGVSNALWEYNFTKPLFEGFFLFFSQKFL